MCSSNASRQAIARVNEIVCYRLDGSLNALVVAPHMTDLHAAGGGTDDYSKLPKGNLDVTGEYFIWTSNAGSTRLDAFIVHVPQALLGVPTAAPAPTDPPAPGGSLTWSTLVNVTASGGGLQKTSGCDGCPDGKALSEQQISGTATLEWTVPETRTLRLIGLSTGTSDITPDGLRFGIRLQSGVAEVRESGQYRSDVTFSAGDTFRISVDNGLVRYLKNGSVFYTSATPADAGLRVGAIFYGLNGAISSVTLVTTPAVTPAGAAIQSGPVCILRVGPIM